MKLHQTGKLVFITGLLMFSPITKAMNTHIQTDNTLSGIAAFSSDLLGASQLYTLSEANGQLAGNNLFFSFSHFNIGSGDTTWFSLNTPDLANVINRVTGANESLIDGQLKLTNAPANTAPNFFFINPAGITLGPGASVDVPGSFYVSTANSLKFSDGNQYQTNHPTITSSLSAASPESFGFLGNETGNLNIQGTESDKVELTFKPGSDIGFIANNIKIDQTNITNSDISKAGPDLKLIAIGPSIIGVDLTPIPDQATAGNIIIQNANLDISGNGLGNFIIQSGIFSALNSTLTSNNNGNSPIAVNDGFNILAQSLFFDHSLMRSTTFGAGNAANIAIKVENDLKLINSTMFYSNTISSGNAGTLSISAKQLEMSGKSFITSYSWPQQPAQENTNAETIVSADGKAGDVIVNVTDAITLDSSEISAGTKSNGNAGNVIVNTHKIDMYNRSEIASRSMPIQVSYSLGGGGDVIEPGFNDIPLVPVPIYNSQISTGKVGDVTINATEYIHLNAAVIRANTYSSGNAGNISINTDNLQIINESAISSSSLLDGDPPNFFIDNTENIPTAGGHAGNITIYVSDNMSLKEGGVIAETFAINADAGKIKVIAGNLALENSLIASDSFHQYKEEGISTGNAGAVDIAAQGKLILDRNSSISTNASASELGGRANAGTVSVTADQIELRERSSISSSISLNVSGIGSLGKSGNVTITANDSLQLINGSHISTSSTTTGNPGNITINANYLEMKGKFFYPNNIVDPDPNSIESNGITFQKSGKGGAGGNVIINVLESLVITDGGEISSNTLSKDNAGNVSISAQNVEISQGAKVESASLIYGDNRRSAGKAGNVTIRVNDTLALSDNAEVSTKTHSNNEAGNITITADQLLIDHAEISSAAESGSKGKTGNIAIDINENIKLSNKATISITNDASLTDLSTISGNINIKLAQGLYVTDSSISAESASSTGGSITIDADETIYLDNSPIVTSALGQEGNGGNITIASDNFIMNGGFIQANTQTQGGNGGKITISSPNIIPGSGIFLQGGNEPINFQPLSRLNVIQSAAPNGISGIINVTAPQLNLSSFMLNLEIESMDERYFHQHSCSIDEKSSLRQLGKGGKLYRAREFLLTNLP